MTISQGSVLMNIEDTSVSFHQPERVMFKPLRTIDGIRLLQVEDLAPRVLDTLTRHGKKKYFYDVYFILRVISIAKLFELYDLKYQRSSAIHILKSLTFFDEAEKDEDPGIFEPTLTWSRVKRTICKEVRNYKMIQKLAAKSQR